MAHHLNIDDSLCIGCAMCTKVCIRAHLKMSDKHPIEEDGVLDCFDCGHCASICPKNAISLRKYPDFVPEKAGTIQFQPEDLLKFMADRRSIRWFTGEKVSRKDLDMLMRAAMSSPAIENKHDVSVVVVDDSMMGFMEHLSKVLAKRTDLPRVRQLIQYLKNPSSFPYNPLIWEGTQAILMFSATPDNALIAMTRMELMAYSMGLGGFYSHWIQLAEQEDHDLLMEFFPEIPNELGLRCAFIIGHPRVKFRRTVPREMPQVTYR